MLGGVAIPFQGPSTDGPVRILGVWFRPDLQLERNWSEVQSKGNAQVGIWLSRRLSLKGRAEACAVYVFPLVLYRLAVHPLPKARRLALQQSLFRLLWGTRCGDKRRVGLFIASSQTQRLKVDLSRWAKQRLFASAERPFVTYLGPVTFRKELYRELVVGSASDPLNERRGWTAEEIRSHWNCAPGWSLLNHSKFSLT